MQMNQLKQVYDRIRQEIHDAGEQLGNEDRIEIYEFIQADLALLIGAARYELREQSAGKA